jgi:hypothetical protein
MMPNDFRHNHYVPEWYQRRFLPPSQADQELHYLDLSPGFFVDPRGISHARPAVRRQGFKHCFAQDDLYIATFGSGESTRIEREFFGTIDREGAQAADYFAKFNHTAIDRSAFQRMLLYMSTQKLRTPKGLGWLAARAGTSEKQQLLRLMLKYRQLHCAIWTECVWQIADASNSDTKFLISDHPVTVYNRGCDPTSKRCQGDNDPDIWLHGTHTIFPLCLDKVLILTNLSWVRNPYQSAVEPRPNPVPFRDTMFKFMDIQILRYLTENEVREINLITKTRARRFVGAAREEWLYPERPLPVEQWSTYGQKFLLMPDPRSISLGGEMFWRNADGTGGAMDEYGRRPEHPDYGKESRTQEEGETLLRFQGEFARLCGPYRRGRSFELGRLEEEMMSDSLHQYYLSLDNPSGRGKVR